MTKKHKMTVHEYEAYQKIHPYDDVLAEEKAKIEREVGAYQELSRRHGERIERQLQTLVAGGNPAAWEDDPSLDEEAQRAQRELRNARTHKRRLKGLKLHEGSG